MKIRYTLLLAVLVFVALSFFVSSPVAPRCLRSSVSAAPTEEAVVYVTQIGSHSITAFTTPSHTPKGVIPTFNFSNGVGVSPDNRFLYLGKRSQVGLSVFDVATHALVTNIGVSSNAIDFAFTRDGRFMYVMHDTSGATVEKIDLATHSIVGQVTGLPVVASNTIDSGVLSPDNQLLYVTFASITPSATESGVAVVETVTNTVVDFIPFVGFPSGIVMTPDGRFLYVNGRSSGDVRVIDTATRAVVATISVPASAQSSIDITPDGRFVYVAANGGFQQPDKLHVIATATNTIVQTIVDFEGAQGLWGVAVSPDGRLVYVVAQDRGKVFVLDQATNSVVTAVSVPGNPLEITIWPGVQDAGGPVTSNVDANPNPVEINSPTTLTAVVDDSAAGGSTIAAAQYMIDGGASVPMSASDGTFDQVSEAVTGVIPAFTAAGVHTVCVSGADSAGNTGDPSCIELAVYNPSGGFVTGAGKITSPPGADLENPTLDGPATFAFVSKYHSGATVPDGNLRFRFKQGDLTFDSTSMEWLVVTGQPRAMFKGEGELDDGTVCKFQVDAWDESFGAGGSDAFGIKIFACGPGGAFSRYSLAAVEIDGGEIKIHQN